MESQYISYICKFHLTYEWSNWSSYFYINFHFQIQEKESHIKIGYKFVEMIAMRLYYIIYFLPYITPIPIYYQCTYKSFLFYFSVINFPFILISFGNKDETLTWCGEGGNELFLVDKLSYDVCDDMHTHVEHKTKKVIERVFMKK